MDAMDAGRLMTLPKLTLSLENYVSIANCITDSIINQSIYQLIVY